MHRKEPKLWIVAILVAVALIVLLLLAFQGGGRLPDATLREAVRAVAALGWLILAIVLIQRLWRPLVHELLPRMTSMKLGGLELAIAEKSIDQAIGTTEAVEIRRTVEAAQIAISDIDRNRALARGQRCIGVLRGKRILWVDDEISNNWYERRMLAAFSLDIEQVARTEDALHELSDAEHRYDLVISDIERWGDNVAGIKFLDEYNATAHPLPVIFYVTKLDSEKPTPRGAFGITNRPDALLHLVADALERAVD